MSDFRLYLLLQCYICFNLDGLFCNIFLISIFEFIFDFQQISFSAPKARQFLCFGESLLIRQGKEIFNNGTQIQLKQYRLREWLAYCPFSRPLILRPSYPPYSASNQKHIIIHCNGNTFRNMGWTLEFRRKVKARFQSSIDNILI